MPRKPFFVRGGWPGVVIGMSVLAGCARTTPYEIAIAMSEQGQEMARLAYADFAAAEPEAADRVRLRFMPAEVSDRAPMAILVADQLARDESVIAFVGFAASSASIAASPILQKAGLVEVAPQVTSPLYGLGSNTSFRLVPPDDKQAQFLFEQAYQAVRPKRAVIYYVPTDYSRPLRSAIRDLAKARGVEVVYEADIPPKPEAMARSASVAVRAKPDVIFWISWVARDSDMSILIDSMNKAGLTAPIYGSDAAGGPDTFVKPEIFHGVTVVNFEGTNGTPEAAVFTDRVRARVGYDVNMTMLLTYDAVTLLLTAVKDGAMSRGEIREYLQSLGGERPAFRGWTGAIQFDSSNYVSRTYVMRTVGAPSDAASRTD